MLAARGPSASMRLAVRVWGNASPTLFYLLRNPPFNVGLNPANRPRPFFGSFPDFQGGPEIHYLPLICARDILAPEMLRQTPGKLEFFGTEWDRIR
jgi:hypothetical protein